jgi:hypothetical protein
MLMHLLQYILFLSLSYVNHVYQDSTYALACGQYIYGRASQTEQRLGQLIFSGHLDQQLLFLPTGRFFVLPCHSISTDEGLMKFPDKTLKFNFNLSPKAINSLITQSACVYLDLLPHVKRILTEIYAGNQYFIIQ